MKFALLVLAAASLAGCSTHPRQTIASARAAGVSDGTIAKLDHHGILVPNDLIELKRRGVPDSVPIRHLDKVGVDYVAQRDDFRHLRAAGVRPAVRDALSEASRKFVDDRYAPRRYEVAYDAPWHYGGRWWWPYADVSLGYSWGHWRCR